LKLTTEQLDTLNRIEMRGGEVKRQGADGTISVVMPNGIVVWINIRGQVVVEV
jgi:hypothetical protein